MRLRARRREEFFTLCVTEGDEGISDAVASCSPSPREVGERGWRAASAQTSRTCKIVARRERGVGSLQLLKPIANT